MRIFSAGQVVVVKDLIFTDGYYMEDGTYKDVYCDKLAGHPGVVLIPTTENDEHAYTIHMTSDKNRAQKQSNKYHELFDGMILKKKSYVNIAQISLVDNNFNSCVYLKKGRDMQIPFNQYAELVEKTYNYHQYSIGDSDEKSIDYFNKIKGKLETIIKINERQKEINDIFEVSDYPILDAEIIGLMENMSYEDKKRSINLIGIAGIKRKDLEKYTLRGASDSRLTFRELNESKRYFNFASRIETASKEKLQKLVKDMYSKDINIEKTTDFLRIVEIGMRLSGKDLEKTKMFKSSVDRADTLAKEERKRLEEEKEKAEAERIAREQHRIEKRQLIIEKSEAKKAKRRQDDKSKAEQKRKRKLENEKKKYGDFDPDFY